VIVGAAVCPGAPFLIDGTADAIAFRQQSVAVACAAAVSRLPPADLTVLIAGSGHAATGAPGWRWLSPGTRIDTAPLRRGDLPDHDALRLSGGGATGAPEPVAAPSVGTMVGAFLLAHGPQAVPGTETVAVEVAGDPAAAAGAIADRLNSTQRIAVLVIADGSACHGDAAPGRGDDRADAFDAALARALGSGDPAALQAATADRELARELMATVDPLAVLAGLTASRAPDAAELLYSAAPLGVGYLVASWGWAPS
jgi:hypothetical protein